MHKCRCFVDVPEEIRHYFDDIEAAFKAQNAPQMADFCTENAVFVSNSTVMVGRKAIADFWNGIFEKGLDSIKVSLDVVEPHGVSDFAVAVGTFQFLANGNVQASGPFSKLFRKENGRWLSDLHRCMVYRHA